MGQFVAALLNQPSFSCAAMVIVLVLFCPALVSVDEPELRVTEELSFNSISSRNQFVQSKGLKT